LIFARRPKLDHQLHKAGLDVILDEVLRKGGERCDSGTRSKEEPCVISWKEGKEYNRH